MVKFTSETSLNNNTLAWNEKKTKTSFAAYLIRLVEDCVRLGTVEGTYGECSLLYLVDGVFHHVNNLDVGKLNVMTYENAVCTIHIQGNGTKRDAEIKGLLMSVPLLSRVPHGVVEPRFAKVELDELDLLFLDRAVDVFMEEEAAFLAAEKRFAARDPLAVIHGMTPTQALDALKALRLETL